MFAVALPPSGTKTVVGVMIGGMTITSLSVAVTATDIMPGAATVIVRVPAMVSLSAAAASVTVCGWSQFALVKVSVAPLVTTMLGSPAPAVEVTATAVVGDAVRRTE